MTDHLSGRTGGRIARCTVSNTCPKNFDANSSNEYWVKAGSLLHTDTRGKDLPDPDNVRFYLISGLSHGVGNVTSRGPCQQFLNPTSPFPALRALLMALDQWVVNGTEPPPSQVPRQSDQTAVMAVPRPGHQTGVVTQEALGWPTIPGVTYTGVITSRYHLDFGPMFDKGVISQLPALARRTSPRIRIFVSKVDQDGNEVAGIRLPPVEAPIATTTGWALRRAEFGENDGCEANGQHVAFKTTKAERLAAGDPRLSLEERYKNHDGYVAAVTKAAEDAGNPAVPSSSRRAAVHRASTGKSCAPVAVAGRGWLRVARCDLALAAPWGRSRNPSKPVRFRAGDQGAATRLCPDTTIDAALAVWDFQFQQHRRGVIPQLFGHGAQRGAVLVVSHEFAGKVISDRGHSFQAFSDRQGKRFRHAWDSQFTLMGGRGVIVNDVPHFRHRQSSNAGTSATISTSSPDRQRGQTTAAAIRDRRRSGPTLSRAKSRACTGTPRIGESNGQSDAEAESRTSTDARDRAQQGTPAG